MLLQIRKPNSFENYCYSQYKDFGGRKFEQKIVQILYYINQDIISQNVLRTHTPCNNAMSIMKGVTKSMWVSEYK